MLTSFDFKLISVQVDVMPETQIKNMVAALFPALMDSSTMYQMFYGYSGTTASGERFSVQYDLDQRAIEAGIKRSYRQQSDIFEEDIHPDDRDAILKINNFLHSLDHEIRYMGLYFLSLNHNIDSIFQSLLMSVIDDVDSANQAQIMWVLCHCVRQGVLIDQAYRFVLLHCCSDDPILRMWSIEIIQAFIESGRIQNIDHVLKLYAGEKDPLVQVQLLLLKEQVQGDDLDIDLLMALVQISLRSESETVRGTGLYLLTKLKDYLQTHDFIEQEILHAMSDIPSLQMQALWVLSQCVHLGICEDQVESMAHAAFVADDWHVRFGGAVLLYELAMLEDEIDFDTVDWIIEQCCLDSHMFLQFFGQLHS